MPLLGYDPARDALQERSVRVGAHSRVSKVGKVYHVNSYDRELIAATLAKAKVGRSVRLPDGTTINRDKDGDFAVSDRYSVRRRSDPAEAADLARDVSARSAHPAALGGGRRFSDAKEVGEAESPAGKARQAARRSDRRERTRGGRVPGAGVGYSKERGSRRPERQRAGRSSA